MVKSAIAPERSFASILSRPSNEIDRTVKQLPVGHYRAIVQGQPRYDKSSKKQTPFVEFQMKILEVIEADEEALDEYLTSADGKKKKITDCTINNVYYLTEAAAGMVLRFLDDLDGLDEEEALEVKDTLEQRISEAPGKSCIITIRHEPRQSGDGMIARIGGTARESTEE